MKQGIWTGGLGLVAALWLLTSAATDMAVPAKSGSTKIAIPRPDHIVIVIEENKSYSTIMAGAAAPFIHQLARRAAVLTRFYAVTHPSLPNYLALFSGSTQQVTDDGCDYHFTGPNLYTELRAVGLGFVTYSEDLPTPGFAGCGAGAYRKKHNPAAYWQGGSVPPGANRPFAAFPKNFDKLPAVALVIPNQMNDMHDGSVSTGDAWLRRNLAAYAGWAARHDSLLIVTWDEDDYTEDNRILTLILGKPVLPGQYPQRYTHYNLLRTIADMFGLAHPGKSAAAAPITGIWRK